MSPHAAKARGILDRGRAAPIGGHEGMPNVSAQGILEDQPMIGNDHSGDKSDGLIPDHSLFEVSGSNVGAAVGDGSGAGDDDLVEMPWPTMRLARSASLSSTGSGEPEESEVRESRTSRDSCRVPQNYTISAPGALLQLPEDYR